MELHPLHQFEIHRLVPLEIAGVDLSYTNSALLMTIVVAAVTALTIPRHSSIRTAIAAR